MGKTMEEWCRFSVCFWHTFRGTGQPQFRSLYKYSWWRITNKCIFLLFIHKPHFSFLISHFSFLISHFSFFISHFLFPISHFSWTLPLFSLRETIKSALLLLLEKHPLKFSIYYYLLNKKKCSTVLLKISPSIPTLGGSISYCELTWNNLGVSLWSHQLVNWSHDSFLSTLNFHHSGVSVFCSNLSSATDVQYIESWNKWQTRNILSVNKAPWKNYLWQMDM